MDVWVELCKLLKEAGLRPYFKQPHPTEKGQCIHGRPMGPFCPDCADRAYGRQKLLTHRL